MFSECIYNFLLGNFIDGGAILFGMGYFEHDDAGRFFTISYLLQQRHITKKKKKTNE